MLNANVYIFFKKADCEYVYYINLASLLNLNCFKMVSFFSLCYLQGNDNNF